MGSLWGWGMIGLGDTVKSTRRRDRKEAGKVVQVHSADKEVTVEYADGQKKRIRMGDTRNVRR